MIPVRRAALSTALATLAAVAVAGGLSGCAGSRDAASPAAKAAIAKAQPPADVRRTIKDTPFERTWDLQLGRPVEGAWVIADVPELLFFQLAGGHEIVAVDAMSGNTRWVGPALPEPLRHAPGAARVRLVQQQGRQTAYDDRLYAVSQDILYCIDIASGQLIWRYELPFSPSSSPRPVGSDGNLRVFFGDWSGRVQAVGFEAAKGFPLVAWQFPTGATVTATAVEREDLVYVGDGAGVVHAFKLDREQVWAYHAGGRIDGGVALRDRVLFVGTSDNILYALNRLTGEKLGQVNLNAPVTRAPLVFRNDRERVFAWVSLDQGERGGLYGFKAVSDTVPFSDASRHPLEVVRMAVDWHLPGVDTLVGSSPGQLYVTAGDLLVRAVDRTNGKILWTWDAGLERAAEQQAAGVRPADQAKTVGLISYNDSTDLNRSFYAIDDKGGVVAYRFYGYAPDEPVAEAVPTLPKKEKPAADGAAAPAPAAQ